MRFARDGVLLVLLAAAALLFGASQALAAVQLQPCGKNLTCGQVAVPLDPSGAVPGQVSLYVKRFARTANPTGGTIIALAGGPGQSAVDLLDGFEQDLAPLLANRALVVFDPRGVGRSGDLTCPEPGSQTSPFDWVGQCATALGPRRAFYSTADSVADIDAVRTALGLQQVTLHGVSYGTYTALAYARAHPAQVDHLILDSSIPADGAPLFNLNSMPAMRRVLGAAGLHDLTTLLRRPATRLVLDGHHARISSEIAGETAFEALFASDLHPFVRASLPAALHLAAGGDISALVRLNEVSFALTLDDPRPVEPILLPRASIARTLSVDVDYLATTCEDHPFPWSAGDTVAVRQAKLQALEGALAPASFAPFSLETLTSEAAEDECAAWPEASDSPNRISGPLPAVPTLILSGRDDIRTPLEDATTLAGQLPNARLLPVPNTGHAVLYADDSGCAKRALAAFIANRPVAQCGSARREPVDPLPPELARLAAVPGLPGAPGRVLRATVLTLRHDVGFMSFPAQQLGFAAGTRAGYMRGSHHGSTEIFKLTGISYVNGVSLSGRLTEKRGNRAATGRLTVKVHGHSYGEVSLTKDGKISGRLGGRQFQLSRSARERINSQGGLNQLPFS